jgi:hypothetical protein
MWLPGRGSFQHTGVDGCGFAGADVTVGEVGCAAFALGAAPASTATAKKSGAMLETSRGEV